ncbi:hypothetical protein B0H12DRAFT_219403 [Mycena haematopus]|nr:hypothetical protein B0H12DRAFT_219403 [Mycena haematopus]
MTNAVVGVPSADTHRTFFVSSPPQNSIHKTSVGRSLSAAAPCSIRAPPRRHTRNQVERKDVKRKGERGRKGILCPRAWTNGAWWMWIREAESSYGDNIYGWACFGDARRKVKSAGQRHACHPFQPRTSPPPSSLIRSAPYSASALA